jgi:hypothetical protein
MLKIGFLECVFGGKGVDEFRVFSVFGEVVLDVCCCALEVHIKLVEHGV